VVRVFLGHLLNFFDYILGLGKIEIECCQNSTIGPNLVLLHDLPLN